MIQNRSMPTCTVIPELGYPNVTQATDWLCGAFGFVVRLKIADHRAQLGIGDGAMVVTLLGAAASAGGKGLEAAFAVMVRVEDVDAHYARASRFGAEILSRPTDYPYGERQYSCRDLGGHRWTFSQTIADVACETWGGTLVNG
ncbi:VOC family protein [Aquabacter sp. CN5-332]|uniref:VOC family protein n=1 Tax=Aquabacter sp. CN5-332 TaxID=3156608 RepID=UPI0032B4C817